ncbi:MAG: YbaB/EbfC family nucleoid-associated protein [Elusimicrobiota bacterium]|nr:YbaB/EbfC family nucleoid-associated protein [Elusimicrobiota bacterium]
MFNKIKDLMQLRSKMAEVKKRLDTMVIKVESPSKFFEITISGSQEVKEIKILKDIKNVSSSDIETDLQALFNKAVKDSQIMAAQAMGDIAGMGGAA